MEQSSPPPPNPKIKPVPEELLGQLHDANAQFHQGKEAVEAAMDGTEFSHQERINQAEEQLRRAEQEVEEVEEQIDEKLRE